MTWVAVFLGGGVGSVMHFGLGEGMRAWWPEATAGFPWGVLAANVLATGLLAWCAVAGADVWGKTSPLWFFMTVGVCGGFSTFSTFAVELLNTLRQHQWLQFLVLTVGSIVGGLLVAAAGYQLGGL